MGEKASQRRKKRRGFKAKDAERIIEQGGNLTLAQLLRCKVRYFSDGVVLGSRAFVERFFTRMKEARLEEHEKRISGARKMRHVQGQKLFTMRDLRKDVVGGY